ncbi:MAG: TPM domain-containing protein, partial [Clostridia bacterium]|nr:TPM domain-containing protein [Clostridia bacterium]
IFSEAVINAMKTAYDTNESYYGGIMGFYAAAETALDTPVYETAPIGGNAVTNAPGSYVTEFEKVERTLPLVTDDADLIPDGVEAELLARCEKIAEEYEMEVAIHTTYDFGGLIAEAYADDYYDFNGYGYGENDDGMLVVYKPGEEGEREIYITTHGNGSGVFFEGIRDGIITDMKDYLIAEDYEKAFNTYLDRAEEQLKPGTFFLRKTSTCAEMTAIRSHIYYVPRVLRMTKSAQCFWFKHSFSMPTSKTAKAVFVGFCSIPHGQPAGLVCSKDDQVGTMLLV